MLQHTSERPTRARVERRSEKQNQNKKQNSLCNEDFDVKRIKCVIYY